MTEEFTIKCADCDGELYYTEDEEDDKKTYFVEVCENCIENKEEEAYQEGYDEGYKKGLDDGYSEAYSDGYKEKEDEVKEDLERLEELELALDRLGIRL